MNRTTASLGFWASLVAFACATAYSAAQIISPPLLPVLYFPWNEILIIAPSFVLPLAYIIALNCVDAYVPEERKIWTHMALSFGLLYTAFVCFTYIIQLATVIPFTLKGMGDQVNLFRLTTSNGHWIQAVDGLGYAFMSVSALFAALAFPKEERWLRRSLFAHGLLAPFIILPLWIPPMIVVGMLWFITGPTSLIFLARFFKTSSSASYTGSQ